MKTALSHLAAALIVGAGLNGFAQSTAITYQGRLDDAAGAVTGRYDLRFALYDDTSNGSQWGPALTNAAVVVSNGLFTTTLDFGSGVFMGGPRWIEIGVRTNGVGEYATLNPRQPLTPAPYAIMANSASNLVGALPASQLSGTLPSAQFSGTYSGAVALNNTFNSFSGNGSGLTGVNAATLGGYGFCQLPCYWNLGGNAGTAPGSMYVGTSDNQPLTFKVNNTTALQIRPGATLPNIVGGLAGFMPSVIASGVSGAVIAGGNAPSGGVSGLGGGDFQAVYDDDGTIGGGFGNKVGSNNGDSTDAAFATVAGGIFNTAMAYGATVAGGDSNLADGQRAAVLGGYVNRAGGATSSVGGGLSNQATGSRSTIGGGQSNLATNTHSAVAGGGWNTASGISSFIGGGGGDTFGGPWPNTASGNWSAILGGWNNTAAGYSSVISGGGNNQARSTYSTVGGGSANVIGTNAQSATIAGGEGNGSEAIRSTIGGGLVNTIGLDAWESVLAGGSINTIRSNAPFGTLSGGRQNLIGAGASLGIIPGGFSNEVNAVLGLAAGNRAKANHQGAFVWADSQNADFASTSSDQFAVRASGGAVFSMNNAGLQVQGSALISKGATTRATARQFAISHTGDSNWGLNLGYVFNPGVEAAGVIQALDNGNPAWLHINPSGGQVLLGSGSEVSWGDHAFSKLTPDQGGSIELGNSLLLSAKPNIDFHYGVNGVQDYNVRLANDGDNQLTCSGNFRAQTLTPLSDRNAKENFAAVDAREVLRQVAALPISRWNFKTEAGVEHVGPMAQDFHAKFGVGADDKHIATVDADGVALAAIQGLNQKLEEKNAALENQVAELKAMMKTLAEKVNGGAN